MSISYDDNHYTMSTSTVYELGNASQKSFTFCTKFGILVDIVRITLEVIEGCMLGQYFSFKIHRQFDKFILLVRFIFLDGISERTSKSPFTFSKCFI